MLSETSYPKLGPHGLGDPDDKRLRKVEKDVLIPKLMREKARAENCKVEVTDFLDCVKSNGLGMVIKCQPQNKKMKSCLTKWYQNEEFKNICTEEYLKSRSEYRRTGIKQNKKGS